MKAQIDDFDKIAELPYIRGPQSSKLFVPTLVAMLVWNFMILGETVVCMVNFQICFSVRINQRFNKLSFCCK